MKDSYNISVPLNCITCGDSNFSYNEDQSWIKCNRCDREYPGGKNELIELNQEKINQEIQNMGNEFKEDAKKDIKNMLKKAFKGNKNFRLK